jgi:sugar/nucleoside kinase (ribokinase family)
MMYDVTVIGEIYLDHVFSGFQDWPGPGEEIFTDEYAWELGGGAVTTACALSRLGRSVQLIGVVGEDQFPMIEARLAAFDVSTKHITRASERSGVTVSSPSACASTQLCSTLQRPRATFI